MTNMADIILGVKESMSIVEERINEAYELCEKNVPNREHWGKVLFAMAHEDIRLLKAQCIFLAHLEDWPNGRLGDEEKT